ncbi:MAG TPA: zf-HC2 domain-containing protein [Thermoanaerobaculia bacterium]|nr:zf-HC2 domain-containing protein [Thermoanaerobaculia bacterium]
MIAFVMDYIDGTLAARERAEFERHLAVCRSCVAYLKTYQATMRMETKTNIADVTVPEELVRAILASRGA